MLAGIELMHTIQKRQRMVKAGEEDRTAAEQFYALAASSPHGQGQRYRYATRATAPREDVDDQ
jgi:gamma-glutamyl:cysteine ligase YbdK (ATP-grasp superfamily)